MATTSKQFRRVPYPTTQLREIVWRFREVEELPAGFVRDHLITSPDTFVEQYRFLFDTSICEKVVVFLLNARCAVYAIETVTTGTISESLIHPREVYRAAVLGMASAIIVAHNHPSGDPEPSKEDVEVTVKLKQASEILRIGFTDHIIFGSNGKYTSMRERGII